MRKLVKKIGYSTLVMIAFLGLSIFFIWLFVGGERGENDTVECGDAFLITFNDLSIHNNTILDTKLRDLENFTAAHLLDEVQIKAPNKINVSLIILPFTTTKNETQDFYSALKEIGHNSRVVYGSSCSLDEFYQENVHYPNFLSE